MSDKKDNEKDKTEEKKEEEPPPKYKVEDILAKVSVLSKNKTVSLPEIFFRYSFMSYLHSFILMSDSDVRLECIGSLAISVCLSAGLCC